MNIKDKFITSTKNNLESNILMYDSNVVMSYDDLYRNANHFCGILIENSVNVGEVVLIQAANPMHVLIGFWGTILRGAIPAMYPIGANIQTHIPAIQTLCNQFHIKTIICDTQLYPVFSAHMENYKVIDIPVMSKSGIENMEEKVNYIIDEINPIAMLQFSSGSTGTPKGVMLTHDNVIHDVYGLIHAINLDEKDKVFSWLPLSHDFAIIGMHMSPLFVKGNQIIMSPTTFLRNPSIFAKVIDQHKMTITAMPNFAMNLVLSHFDQSTYETMDLSTLRAVVTAGEGISAKSCDKFVEAFSKNHLTKHAIVPAYGLAEATVAVTFGSSLEDYSVCKIKADAKIGEKIEVNDTLSNAKSIVGSGKMLECNQVYICDDEGNRLAERTIGNVIITGKNVSAGYYMNEEATKEILNDHRELYTGDIGFLYEGELYITGRKKEMIIINGRNYFASDIETVLRNNMTDLKEIQVAAFKVHNRTKDIEELYIAVEGEVSNRETLAAKIKKCVFEKMQMKVSRVVFEENLPKTVSGKIKYFVLTQQYERELNENVVEEEIRLDINSNAMKKTFPQKADVLSKLKEIVENLVEEKLQPNDINRPFVELGIDSIKIEYLFHEIEKTFQISITMDIIWNYPTLEQFADYISQHQPAFAKEESVFAENETFEQNPVDNHHTTDLKSEKQLDDLVSESFKLSSQYDENDIAVISMACHFPGEADTPVEYFKNLMEKKDGICFVDEERSKYCKRQERHTFLGGYLHEIGELNVSEFGITPMEAQKMDPQQKLLLKTTYELLSNASLDKEKVSGTNTGVYIGISNHDYSLQLEGDMKDIYASTGNAASIAANRISYLYNLTGPSMSIDTACSSSLVSIHTAAKALKNGDCKVAIAGGVNVILDDEITKAFADANMLSKDGRCKTFDESADGYVRGEGCGLVLLKSLKDAVRDQDTIYAIVKGSAINQDGKSNGLTAPNGSAQQQVIRKALSDAKLSPKEIDYIEAHGTGTKLGDPIEMNSINLVFKDEDTKGHRCYVGSVKTKIGHLEAAAGIAGFIKAVLMLNKNQIPPMLHFHKLNPYIVMDETKLVIATEENVENQTIDLKKIGISSFGFGGTNCHMIVSKYKEGSDLTNLQTCCKKGEEYWVDTRRDKSTRGDETDLNQEILHELKKQTKLLEQQINLLEHQQIMPVSQSKRVDSALKVQEVQEKVKKALSDVTAYPVSSLHLEDGLQDELGIDSIMMSKLMSLLQHEFSLEQNVVGKVVAASCEAHATIGDLCNVLNQCLGNESTVMTISHEVEEVETHNFPVQIERSVTDFEEYQKIHDRLANEKHNPYYKVNYGVPRDLIITDEGEKINYSTYNYVGLNGDEEIENACIDAIRQYGTSVSGSRMISGEIKLHRELEDEITDFLGTQDTIVYIGGYTTNVSAISTIVSEEDLILHDALSHNSIITGCILSGAKRLSFKHNDMDALEASLKKVRNYYRRVLIVVEGIYSMDGDICNLPKLIELKKKYGALLMVDEAHSLGTIGDCGRGVGSYYQVNRKDVDLWMGTMSKSLASCGGYISGSKELIQLLKYTSDGFMFSVGITPANAAACLAAIRKLRKSPEIVEKLKSNSEYFLSLMKEKGLDTGLATGTAIVPCILKDSKKCMLVSKKLYEKGINVMPIVYPAVAEQEARLRFFISSEHTQEEMRYTVDVLARIVEISSLK